MPGARRSKARPYFDIERLNMRSIFSFVASQHCWLAVAAARAWSALAAAAVAACWAAAAARAALSAAAALALLALIMLEWSACSLATWVFRVSTSAYNGFRSTQPAANTTQRAAAPTLTNFIMISYP